MKYTTTESRLLTVLLFFCIVTIMSAGSSSAQPFPAKGAYDFYIYGEPAGSNSFTSSVENNILTIVSTTSLHFDEYDLELDSKTRVDAATLRPIAFSYTGLERRLIRMEGSVSVHGDTISGIVGEDDDKFPSRLLADIPNTIFFESYVAEHEILLARKFLASGEDFKEIWFFFPSDFMLTPSIMSLESDIQIETRKGPILCTKISVSLQGGTPFLSYIDQKTNIPIYLEFPGVNTELFYRDYFGDEAVPKYTRPKK